jgi:hypothetical protein
VRREERQRRGLVALLNTRLHKTATKERLLELRRTRQTRQKNIGRTSGPSPRLTYMRNSEQPPGRDGRINRLGLGAQSIAHRTGGPGRRAVAWSRPSQASAPDLPLDWTLRCCGRGLSLGSRKPSTYTWGGPWDPRRAPGHTFPFAGKTPRGRRSDDVCRGSCRGCGNKRLGVPCYPAGGAWPGSNLRIGPGTPLVSLVPVA